MKIYLITSHCLEATELLTEIGQTDGVVEDSVGAVVVGVGTADDTDEREVLTVSTGDSIEHAETADGECDDASTYATRPGVAVGGVSSVELIAAANEVKSRLSDQMVEKGKIEIAGDGEDITDANLNQTASQVTAESGLAGSNDGGRDRGLNSRGDPTRRTTDVSVIRGGGVTNTDLGIHFRSKSTILQNQRTTNKIKNKNKNSFTRPDACKAKDKITTTFDEFDFLL